MHSNAAIYLLGVQMIGLASMVLALFWLRRRIGLTPLYVSLGVFQPVQVLLSSSIYVDILPGVPVSPGTLMFAASLLAVLLVYIREDAIETRKVIYGILGANLTMTLVMFAASVQLKTPGTANFLNIVPEIFYQGARVTAVGTFVFLADVALLILLYTAARRFFPRHPFLRVFLTMAGVLVFDAVAFTTGAFFEHGNFASLLIAAVLSKLIIASFFSAALIAYLRFVEPSEIPGAAPNHPLRDFFYAFTYREKFELQGQKIDEVEARLEKAQQVARMGFLDWDLASDLVYWSAEMARIIGLKPDHAQQTRESTAAFIHPDDFAAAQASVQKAILERTTHSMDHRMLRTDGTVIWVHVEGEVVDEQAGTPLRFLATLVDITQRKRDETERQQVFERITDAFVALDTNWIYTFVNAKAAQIFDRRPEDLIGKHIWTEFPMGIGQRFDLAYRKAMTDQQPAFLEEYYPPYDRWYENRIYPSPEGLTIYFHDITERVKHQEDLERRGSQDELTGLPNRRAVRETLDALLADERSRTQQVGVIVLNIDRLHQVNDYLGYATGDRVLIQIAQRLCELAATVGCTAARVGGDEFLLMTGLEGYKGSFESIAREATHVLAQPYPVDDQPVYLTCSAGVSWSPEAGSDAAQLLSQADLAMNLAKRRGRNQVVLYSAERSADLGDRIKVGAEMREALQRQEMQLHYQPLVNATDGTIRGAEALMRWDSLKLGSIGPSRFIPVAEDTGMIIQLGDWALRSAIAQINAWQVAGSRAIPLSVNVSAKQFQRSDFVEEIEDALRHAGVAPALLKIEITESTVMEDTQAGVMVLNRLRALGVRVSLDDFGTGYSSLGYLRQLPLDEIKIDRSFVKDVIEDSFASTLCRAIIAMSQQLHFTVVAEGVETEAQAYFLKDAGCQLLQGYLFSKPVPAQQLGDLLLHDTKWLLDGQQVNRASR